jgi:putative membrane protein insertion efficiency factor
MARKFAIFLIRCYQVGISPILGRSCRFSPTCSHYAIAVIQRDGFFVGGWRAFRRILRCHPFNPGGYDPP